ncbi:monosaccharide ABC transporter substrate-binding protein, CUT2 family [Georgenia satyanarayanai]|uniref:Monosaccharide ABC transporter substrate-binding protein, CUT2 family n=1 Tax=Georgenia satyanarayanai TaxID=860221 RepID=A0A2Y9AFI9_9MICO|nr:substrate-binding domain-containing protein [Georgenia satyanarayanai]PYF99422.1 monosaccharide ABC transporter substrate-binding protein (CUT2 family) [Georgenia satyanarayanai]SSA43234.1 monosaccharide ABC transporter substrate-binding protein, CUT2 family [Georgenia satyanarayanai]
MSARTTRRRFAVAAGLSAALLLAGCTGNTPEEVEGEGNDDGGTTNEQPGSSNDETGETVTIGFSAPAADHGWMAAISNAAQEEAEKYDDIDFRPAEGTNDVSLQIAQMETFINDGVDAIVVLPFDGAAVTGVALEAMAAGIPVINVDREFSDPNAARVTVLGDNYGMGVSAGEYMCERLGDQPDAVIAEIAGIDNLPLTQERSQGFADALGECGLDVSNRVAADFTVQGGESATANLLQAAPEIDAIWNHDDDQGVGVMQAIENAGRDEFFVVGGAGSANVMRDIQSGESLVEATVVYPSTQAADGIRLARLLAQGKAMSDLVEVEVPRLVQLYAPVVTADNVDQYIDSAFES